LKQRTDAMCSDWLGDNHDSTCNLVKISEWEMRGIWKRAVCRWMSAH
jgi:hypothetical protein